MPPDVLLGLLEEPAEADPDGGSDTATTADADAAAGTKALPEAVRSLLKDSVLTALVHLDDSQQVREALLPILRETALTLSREALLPLFKGAP